MTNAMAYVIISAYVLAVIGLWRLWSTDNNILWWCLLISTVLTFLSRRTITTALMDGVEKAKSGGQVDQEVAVLNFWIYATMVMTGATLILAAIAVLLSFGAGSQRQSFEDSMTFAYEANRISADLPGIQRSGGAPAAKRQAEAMRGYMERSLAAGKNVTDEFLNTLHPSLAQYYRNNLMQGQRLYLDGLKSSDVREQLQGTQLVMAWSTFWRKNKETILRRLDNP